MRTALRWLPWVLTAAALGLLIVVVPAGPLLASIWGAAVILVRAIVRLAGPQLGRWVDVVFAAVCFLGAFQGGWYLLPAALAFWVSDARADGDLWDARWNRGRLGLVAGVAAAIVGWATLAAIIWAPLYSTRSAEVGPGGLVESPMSAINLAAAGISDRATAVFVVTALLLGAIAVAAVVHARYASPWARSVLAIATLCLMLVSAAGALSIGVLLLPAIALAVVSWLAGHEPRRRRPDHVALEPGRH